tara:strand:- start:1162 stop:1431 length:270 start_codon:yes stop_codon:yes gene_type:complete
MDNKYKDRDSGALYKNDKKQEPKHPDYTGRGTIWGKKVSFSAWNREYKCKITGEMKPYISMSINEPYEKPFESTNTSNPKKYTEKDLPF